ncbi:MAG: non-homologous end-joining DNA ligase [Phycisphaeraceae bacterium]|nr:non-homologous end-joining DNA ligase [Phycisphaeraceae bacterium]
MTRRTYGPYSFDASREQKLLFPDDGLQKSDLIDYYENISDRMLPWLKNRPVSMQRFPDGIGQKGFYQKKRPSHFPDWIQDASIKTEQGRQKQVVIQNKATLAYLADQACITPHTWLSRIDDLDRPDMVVFDLDPSDDRFAPVRRAARRLHELLNGMGLGAYLKTTGSRGLHVFVPIRRGEDFDGLRDWARRAADLLAGRHPDELTTEVRKNKRRGRVYLDTSSIGYGQTVVPPYAVRARPGAPVSMPLRWEELSSGSLHSKTYTVTNAMRRLGQIKDPWSDFTRRACSFQKAVSGLESVAEKE